MEQLSNKIFKNLPGYNPANSISIDNDIIFDIIVKKVCETMHILIEDFYKNTNSRDDFYKIPRHIVSFFAKEKTNLSFQAIAVKMNKISHATIISGRNKIINYTSQYKQWNALVEHINTQIDEQLCLQINK